MQLLPQALQGVLPLLLLALAQGTQVWLLQQGQALPPLLPALGQEMQA